METTLKRLYVGGISPLVTKAELTDRFGKFGKIDDVDIIYRKDEQGNPIKIFAYLSINISDVDLKKCVSVLNKTKWKGGILQIEIAKESFLHRLSQERQEAKEKKMANAQRSSPIDLVLSLEKAGVTDFQMKSAVPGTEVPNHKNWVVSKFGRVLPVLHFNGKKQSKITKYDPSKYCHNIKKIDDTFELVPVSQLTWQLKGGDDEISRKRRGEFPNLMPSPKQKRLNLPLCGANYDTQTNQRIPLASVQTTARQSDTQPALNSKKLGRLQNRSINSMTLEYDSDSEEELQAGLKEERSTVHYAEDSNIEVVDDSFEVRYMTHWAKQKAKPKMNSSCNTGDDSEYDSADTDEIIRVTKQNSCGDLKTTKTETVSDKFTLLKKEGSTFASGTKSKSKDIEMSHSESDSETDASKGDSSDFYSDEEYNDMMQNCFKLDLTMADLETLAKANEFDADDETESESEYDSADIINAKLSYDVDENLQASVSEILPATQKKQNAKRTLGGIKKKLKTDNIQSRVLDSDRQSNGGESDSSDSDEHYESINKNCSADDIKTEALKPKSPAALQCLVNIHELEKGAKGLKGETNKDNTGSLHVKKRRGIEPEEIVASILEDDHSDDEQSNRKKKKKMKEGAPVKPPAFKGLNAVLASPAKVNSLSGSSRMSTIMTAAVSQISNDINLSSCADQTKKTEKPEPSRGLKQIFLEAKSENKSSSSDTSEESNSDLISTSSAAAKPGIHQIGTTKEQTTPKLKRLQDNQKRLVAMMERRKEHELQKEIIKGALLQLNSLSSKKSQHITFNSESESEEEPSTSGNKIVHADEKPKPGTFQLFNSSEEGSDDDKKDDERFEIKTQFEGRSGMKLMQLQSRFGTDERFKMDSRFLESSSEDEEDSEVHKSEIDEDYDLSAEKKKNLGILQSILNINVEPQSTNKQTAKDKKFKDLNALHYDPEKEDHASFETKAKEKKESKSERTKKRVQAEKLPDVSKETYHEIIMDFREAFGASKTQNGMEPETTWDQEVEPEKKEADNSMSSELFSFQNKNPEEPAEFTFSFFGNSTEVNTPNHEPYKTETIKAAKVAWREDPRFQESSSEGEDDETGAAVATENKTSTRPDISTVSFFFFVKNDERLKTGPAMFFRSSNTDQEQEAWEERQETLLEECRKRHKDAKRKIKAKN